MHKNTIKKAMKIKKIVDEHYRPNSHVNCYDYIYRNYITDIYPISRKTFYRLLNAGIIMDGYVGNGCNRVNKKPIKKR